MLELSDIQGIVVRGYHTTNARYSFLSFGSTESAREWVGEAAKLVTDAQEWQARPQFCVNIALSYAGLERLGLAVESLSSFPIEFREDLAKRAGTLGDEGASAPEHWEGGLGTRDVHALAIIHSNNSDHIQEQTDVLSDLADSLVTSRRSLTGTLPASTATANISGTGTDSPPSP